MGPRALLGLSESGSCCGISARLSGWCLWPEGLSPAETHIMGTPLRVLGESS